MKPHNPIDHVVLVVKENHTFDNYFDYITALKGSANIVPWTQFDTDADAGKLPNVSWMYAPSLYSEHPPFGANVGNSAKSFRISSTTTRSQR